MHCHKFKIKLLWYYSKCNHIAQIFNIWIITCTIYICVCMYMGLSFCGCGCEYFTENRVFANGPGDLGSIQGRVIPKTQKMVLDAFLLNTQHYKVRIKGKVGQFREGVAPSPTSWCSSYRKGSLRVTLDYGRQLYFFLYIYVMICKYIYTYIYI